MNNKNVLEIICGIAGGLAGFLFGAADGLFYALVAFVVLDYVTGVISAIVKKELSSRAGLSGIFRKLMVFVLVALANIIDVQVLSGGVGELQNAGVLRSATAAFLLANEGLSILENVAEVGMPIPKKLKAALRQVRGEDK